MSFLSALIAPRESRFTKGATAHPSSPIPWLASGSDSFSGMAVSESNALTSTAVYAAVRILSESVAQLPLKLHRRRSDGGKDLADGEREYYLLHDAPNPETASFTFRETGQSHLLTWGNFYAEIDMDGGGRTRGLWQRRPDRVEVTRRKADNEIVYKFRRDDGAEDVLDRSEVLHVPGLSFNGLVGFSPVRMAREAIGLGLALEAYGASLFGHGTVPGMVYKALATTPEGKERARLELERVHKGPQRAGKVMVLGVEEDIQSVGMPNDDAEFLATRQFQIQEVARIFNMPPHMLKELSRASFSNIEEQDREFVKITLLPWLKRWEAELNRKVLTQRQREAGFFFEFSVDGFLRASFKDRMEGHRTAIMSGWTTPNQVRRLENLDPDPNLDFYLVPGNMAIMRPDGTIEAPMGAQAPADAPERSLRAAPLALPPESVSARTKRSLDARWRLQDAFRALIEDAARRTVTAEIKAVQREISKVGNGVGQSSRRDFIEWLGVFYFDQHPAFLRSVLGSTLLAYMGAVSREALDEVEFDGDFSESLAEYHEEYLSTMSARQSAKSRKELTSVVEGAASRDEGVAAVNERLDQWRETKASVMANIEATQAGAGISRAAYALAGVTVLRWVWNGGDCPLCSRMDGKVVQVGQAFLEPGSSVGDMQIKTVRNHPPLHKGCRCSVSPG